MANFFHQTRAGDDPKNKPRVFFTCHPEDFETHFDKIVSDIFKTHDCAIYYTEDMAEPIAQEELDTDLGQMNLFVVPITSRLLEQPNRTMEVDIAYAKREKIPILPFMMEEGLDNIYSAPQNFGKRQYLAPYFADSSAIQYEDKLRNYLESVLISSELTQRIRAAFDAYVFLSYRKKDRRYANELMKLFHRNPECWDIAIWYDEFLTPGESFADGIQRAIETSKLFALLVTPHLLEEPDGRPNYVMAEEYPAAKRAGKEILPLEMERTDHNTLLMKFREIPDCVDPRDESVFKDRLLSSFKRIAISTNNDEPEHNFLIGLAYLEGIDVEVDREQGMRLITAAAGSELPEAMDWLYRIYANKMYYDEDTPEADYKKAFEWANRRVVYYTRECGENSPMVAMALSDLTVEYVEIIDWVTDGDFGPDADYYFSDSFMKEAISVAEKAYALCLQELGAENAKTMDMMDTLATLYEKTEPFLGEPNMLQRAYELREQEYALRCSIVSDSHWRTGHALDCLIDLCMRTGKYERRVALCQRRYEIKSKEIGEKNAVAYLCQLALAHGDAGNHKLERELFDKICTTEQGQGKLLYHINDDMWWRSQERKLALRETEYEIKCRFLGQEDYETRETLMSIARISYSIGNIQKAKVCLEKYIQQCELLGEEKRILTAVEQLAEIYIILGDYEKAMALSVRCYALQCKFEEVSSIDEQRAVQMLARAYMGMGNYAKALELQERAHNLLCKRFGSGDRKSLIACNYLAEIYCKLNDYATALKLHKSTSSLLCEECHPSDSGALHALNVAAQIHRGLGEYSEAIKVQQKIYARQCEYIGERHCSTLITASELADMYAAIGEYEKAETMETFACSAWSEMLGSEHVKVRSSMNNLVFIYYKTGDIEKLIEIKKRVLAARCVAVGVENADLLMTLCNLEYDYEKCEDRRNELMFDENVYAFCRDTMGEGHVVTMNARSNLAYSYFMCGEYQKACVVFRQVYDNHKKTFCETSFAATNALHQLWSLCMSKEGSLTESMYAMARENANILRWIL